LVTTSKREAQGENGLVAAGSPEASQAGVAVLKQGGNAVDAAVAASLALGASAPVFSGIGGGGFMLVHLAGTPGGAIIDYRERAPRRATEDMYRLDAQGDVVDAENEIGYKAAAVPGTLAGLALALERYGTMPLSKVAQGAISAARDGAKVGQRLAYLMAQNHDDSLTKLRTMAEAGKSLLKPDGSTFQEGETFVQRDLAASLGRIAEEGVEAFYEGFVADALDKDMAANGGLMDKEDLRTYQPVEREPLTGQFQGLEFVTMPPPSSGGIALIQLFGIFDGLDLQATGFNTPETIDRMAKVLGQVFPDRGRVGDPEFVDVPVGELTSRQHVDKLAKDALGGVMAGSGPDDHTQTTHLSVVDRAGNAVALTESLESFFGSGVVVPGTGIFLNNTMHDFDPAPGGPNSVGAGKRPMSSMSPTIFFKDGQPRLVLGSAGGPRIITAVLQVALNVLVHGMGLQEAISAPRFHFQSGLLTLETSLAAEVGDALRGRGYRLREHHDHDYFFGGVNAIQVRDGVFVGGADPRRDGVVVAY